MGKVVASFRILPSDIEVNLEELRGAITNALPSEANVHKFEEEPIAFGLVALHAFIVMPEDISGEMDKIETTLHNVEGIGQIDVLMVRRI
ncbi:MAG: elongation factor 1-beta [Candidatus Bathyarchaeota archaeon]